MKRFRPALLLLLVSAATAFGDDAVKLKVISKGAMPRMGGYVPQRVAIQSEKPKGLTKAPAMEAPAYGELTIGPKDSPTRVIIAADEPDGKPAKLYVDANGDGDLTNDPATTWISRESAAQGGKKRTIHSGSAMIDVKYGKEIVSLNVPMYRFGKGDPFLKENILLYYADYAYEGELSLGGAKFKVMLVDRFAVGDYRGKDGDAARGGSGVVLMIDVNGSGRFDNRGEQFDIRKPFNIKGTTYEITDMLASGASFSIKKSDQTVAQILPPPDLKVGAKAVKFSSKATDGHPIDFPSTYKGKVVMLDFWATWCGPCIAELPNLTAAYEKYHEQGLEILGISLDQANAAEKLASFTREKNMPWRQVYDGKFWEAEVADLYAVDSIPRAFLVDGDTGEILADSSTLRGERLDGTLKAVLSKKGLLREKTRDKADAK